MASNIKAPDGKFKSAMATGKPKKKKTQEIPEDLDFESFIRLSLTGNPKPEKKKKS